MNLVLGLLLLCACGITFVAARRSIRAGVSAVTITSTLWAFAGVGVAVGGSIWLYVIGLAAPLATFVLSGRQLGPGDLTMNVDSDHSVPFSESDDWRASSSSTAIMYAEGTPEAPAMAPAMVNPGSGLPMANSSVDVGGNFYGSGPAES